VIKIHHEIGRLGGTTRTAFSSLLPLVVGAASSSSSSSAGRRRRRLALVDLLESLRLLCNGGKKNTK
jgi:hypothetical protein